MVDWREDDVGKIVGTHKACGGDVKLNKVTKKRLVKKCTNCGMMFEKRID